MAKVTIAEDGRSPIDQMGDRTLLLLGIGFGVEAGRVDEFRLMKIPFTTQARLDDEGIRSFSYSYYKHNFGPISNSIYEDRDVLLKAGLIEGTTGSRRLTDLGERLQRVVLRELPRDETNTRVLRVLKEQARKIAGARTWEEIKKKLYAMKVKVVGEDDVMTIADAPQFADLEMGPSGNYKTFELPERLCLTVSLAFSLTPDLIKSGSTDSGLTIEQVFAV
jgi:hypothetical protein